MRQEVAPVNRDPICTDRLPCERVERPVVGVANRQSAVRRITDSCIRLRCKGAHRSSEATTRPRHSSLDSEKDSCPAKPKVKKTARTLGRAQLW